MNWVVRNWLIAAACLAAISALGSLLETAGFYRASTLLGTVGLGAAGAVAVADGLGRVLGNPSLLGSGRGFARLLALIQILLGALLLANLL